MSDAKFGQYIVIVFGDDWSQFLGNWMMRFQKAPYKKSQLLKLGVKATKECSRIWKRSISENSRGE